MAEYIKLNSDDSGGNGIRKYLNENIPFGQKPSFLSHFQNNQEADKLELIDFGYKNETKNTSNNFYNSFAFFFNLKNKEDSIVNRSRKGNMKMFLYNGKDEPLIVLGPEWPSSLIMIFLLFLIIVYYFNFFKNSINPTIKFYGIIIYIIHLILYLICFLKNPGIPPKSLWIENYFKNKNNDKDKNYSIRICKDCKIIIESTEHIEHCKTCNICVMENEHHSFWIGKCVGKKNKYYYNCFVFMTGVLVLYLVFAFFSIPFYKEKSTIK